MTLAWGVSLAMFGSCCILGYIDSPGLSIFSFSSLLRNELADWRIRHFPIFPCCMHKIITSTLGFPPRPRFWGNVYGALCSTMRQVVLWPAVVCCQLPYHCVGSPARISWLSLHPATTGVHGIFHARIPVGPWSSCDLDASSFAGSL